jgi:hypothetical protein
MAKEAERKLPDGLLEIDFVICDNTLNRKGWRLLVEGIDRTGFEKNPVCCIQHETWIMPVGKWKNLKVENGIFSGTVEFDRNDEQAVKLYWKYKDGYMSAVSLHVIPIEESGEQNMLVSGQRYPTVTKSELLEISLVTIPGQKNAVKLSTPDGQDYKLNIINNLKSNRMDEKEKNAQASSAVVETLQKELDEQKKLNAKNLVKMHKIRGAVQDAEEEHLTKLAESDYGTVEKMLDARTVEVPKKEEPAEETKRLAEEVKSFTQNAETEKNSASNRADWSYYDYFRKDPDALEAMRKNNPKEYEKIELAFQKEAEKQLGCEIK